MAQRSSGDVSWLCCAGCAGSAGKTVLEGCSIPYAMICYDVFPVRSCHLKKKTSTSLCSSLLFCWACLRKSTCRAGPRVLMHPCTNSVSPIRWSPSCPTGRFPKDTNERTKAKNSQEIPCLVLLYICNCWPGHEKWWCLLGFFPPSLSKLLKSVQASSALSPRASKSAFVVSTWKPFSNSLMVMVPLPSCWVRKKT